MKETLETLLSGVSSVSSDIEQYSDWAEHNGLGSPGPYPESPFNETLSRLTLVDSRRLPYPLRKSAEALCL